MSVMALQKMVFPKCSHFFRPVLFLQCYFRDSPPYRKSPTIEIDDVIDNFTNELLQKKQQIWNKRSYEKKLSINVLPEKDLDVSNLSAEQISAVFSCKLNECDDIGVIKLVNQCLQNEICPGKDILVQVLSICAQKGQVSLIQNLKALCEIKRTNFSANFDFSLYEGQAIWMRGNVIKALDIFENLYVNNPFLRRHIKLVLKKLMFEEAKNNSEAILIHLVKFSERIVESYKDYFIMICVWEVCFLSEWFSDQQVALKLSGQYRRLSEVLICRLPYILALSLKSHKTEAVYRLLEIFLNFDLSDHYTLIIIAFLDYHLLQGNVRNYSETIKWCEYKNIPVPCIYREKYLQLLLNGQDIQSSPPSEPNKEKKHDFLF